MRFSSYFDDTQYNCSGKAEVYQKLGLFLILNIRSVERVCMSLRSCCVLWLHSAFS